MKLRHVCSTVTTPLCVNKLNHTSALESPGSQATPCVSSLIQSVSSLCCQSYQWLKEKIISEDGRKQQAKLKELNHIAEKLGCTLPQLAVGKTSPSYSKYSRSSLKQSF